ncbi:MAG: Nif11 family protein [Synergistaceae bacterium]|nr:Nif11 family protein [Synergistaceae bacterium]
MKKFLEAVSKDEALLEEFKALADGTPKDTDAMAAAAVEFAGKHGLTLTADDFKPSEMEELSEDEMKAVAGGATCTCNPQGTGTFLIFSVPFSTCYCDGRGEGGFGAGGVCGCSNYGEGA